MGGMKTTCVVPLHELDRFNEVLESATKAMARKTIVFLDGFTEPPHEGAAACSLCTWWRMRDEKHRRVVFVCSMRAPHDIFRIEDVRPIISDGSDFDDDDEAPSQRRGSSESEPAGNDDQDVEMNVSGSDGDPIVKDQMLFSLESWRLEEYREAVGHEDFLRSVENVFSVTREQRNPVLSEDDCKPAEGELGEEERGIQRAKWITKLLEEKYFVAGGSARLMFDVSLDDAIGVLDHAMRKVTNAKQYLLELAGDSPLLARYCNDDEYNDDGIRLVSSYVMRKFAIKMGPALFQDFSRVCEVNPSVRGYVLEAWFFSSLRHSDLPIRYVQKDTTEMCQWRKTAVFFFDPAKRIRLLLLKPTWLAPLKWNQGGYDAVFVSRDPGLVRFVQLTRADKRGYDAKPFVNALVQLTAAKTLDKVERVEVCYVVPMAKLATFRLPVKSEAFQESVVSVASFAGRWTCQKPDPVFAGFSGEVFLCGVDYEMTNIDRAEGDQVGCRKRARLETWPTN